MDIVSVEQRSKNMAAIKPANTTPELILRKVIFNLGLRYRLHRKDLPSKPDIYIKRFNTLLFVNGCFWHQHKGCNDANIPKSNLSFWIPKLKQNAKRDKINIRILKKMGYKVIIFWQCEIVDKGKKTAKTHSIIGKLNKELNLQSYLNGITI